MAEPEEERHVRPFADWLTTQRKGALNIELGEALADLVSAVSDTGKGGALTLTIKVGPGRGTSLEVRDDCKTKLPQNDREITLWWSDENGNLLRFDPLNAALPFGPQAVPDVDVHTSEVRNEGAGA